MPGTVHVDSHSHVFNAEDLPIDGFLKRLSPVPRLLTGVVSVPLDRLAAWAAPGSGEAEHLLAFLRGAAGLEAVGALPERPAAELVTDAELDGLLLRHLGPVPAEARVESLGGVDDALATQLERLPPPDIIELEGWLREWGDPGLDSAGGQLEGLGDVAAWARSRAGSLRAAVKRYVAALRLITRHRYAIAAELARTYPDVALFTPALVDFTFTAGDRPSTMVPRQIAVHALVAKLSVVGGLPGAPDTRVHPFAPFCPYREVETSELKFWDVRTEPSSPYVPYADPADAGPEDHYHMGQTYDPARAKRLLAPGGDWHSAVLELDGVERSLDLVRHAVELGGFSGVKIYPPAGFAPLGNVIRFGERRGHQLDAALRALYAYCVAMDVPILTHASASNGFADGYDDLASPAGWELALEAFPELRVSFGHFGHLHGENVGHAGEASFGWPTRFVRLIDRFPNVYADVGNSKLAINESFRQQFVALLQVFLGPSGTTDEKFVKRRKRVMYGSDYWLNTLSPDHVGYHRVFNETIASNFDGAVHRWFMGENALRFLGIVDDEGRPASTNANRRRLRELYGAHPLPDWLE